MSTISVLKGIALTPKETVSKLDEYIIGQGEAKRAVAIALRNRWRRQQVEGDLREEISPKNITMIGPTGVGKTEVARRLAKLAQAPFVKVEASKFTEVGYVGKDVDSIVRDLMENAINLVRTEEEERVHDTAESLAKKLVVSDLLNTGVIKPDATSTMETLIERLTSGTYDEDFIEISVPDKSNPFMEVFGEGGPSSVDMGGMFQGMSGEERMKTRKLTVKEAVVAYTEVEAEKLIDMDLILQDSKVRAEQTGIVFIDEIDKVVGKSRGGGFGPEVSREGVQRDLLPLVEGSTVHTKYGPIKTDHMLFIAAGAFHVSKPSNMIPELQGRFPIRAELHSLGAKEFVRILTEPKNALVKQYIALMKAENVTLEFKEEAIKVIAEMAESANSKMENIGARRLHTIMENLLDDLSFKASEMDGESVTIDGAQVTETLSAILNDEDLSKFIL